MGSMKAKFIYEMLNELEILKGPSDEELNNWFENASEAEIEETKDTATGMGEGDWGDDIDPDMIEFLISKGVEFEPYYLSFVAEVHGLIHNDKSKRLFMAILNSGTDPTSTLKLAKEVKSRFGTYSLDLGAGSFKSELRQNPAREVIKECESLLSKIKNARTGFSLDTEMTKEDKKELKEMFDAVIEQIEDFIRTYNL